MEMMARIFNYSRNRPQILMNGSLCELEVDGENVDKMLVDINHAQLVCVLISAQMAILVHDVKEQLLPNNTKCPSAIHAGLSKGVVPR